MERREQMNNTASLRTLSLAELTMVTGGLVILEDDSNNGKGEDTNSQHDGSPEPGTGDRDIG